MNSVWSTVADEFTLRSLSHVRGEAGRAGISVDAIDAFVQKPIDGMVAVTADELQRMLEARWEPPSEWPNAAELQAFYIYMRCMKLWETSADYESIRALIRTEVRAWGKITKRYDPWRLPVDVLVRHTATISACMAVEGAVLCSCPFDFAEQARAVVSQTRAQQARLRRLARPTQFSALVVHILDVHVCYFECLVAVADALIAAGRDGLAALDDLERTIELLARSERSPLLRGDVYASELRAHRHLLATVCDRLRDVAAPVLELREAKLTYVYPFTLEGVRPLAWKGDLSDAGQVAQGDGALAGQRALEVWCDDSSRSGTAVDLAGEVPVGATVSDLTDIWWDEGPEDETYSAISLALPALSVKTTSPDPNAEGATVELTGLSVEIRLTSFGNHYVRVETPLAAMSLHELNQALRRGSLWMGEEAVTGGGYRSWSGIAEYVKSVVEALASRLNGAEPNLPDSTIPHLNVRESINVDADYHVVVEIRSASVQTVSGERCATIDDIREAAGSLLFQPVHRVPVALEEWLCYRTPDDLPNLLESTRFECDFAARTANTTLLFLPASPNWAYLGYREMSEFAAAVPALLRQWRTRLDAQHDVARGEFERWRLRAAARWRLRRKNTELEQARLTLNMHAGTIRSLRVPLRSVELVRSDAHRVFLDNLMACAEVPRLMAELDQHIQRADQQIANMSEFQRSEEEKHTRRYQLMVEVILVFLALAGLGAYVDALYFTGSEGRENWGNREFLGFGVVALLVGIVLVGTRAWR